MSETGEGYRPPEPSSSDAGEQAVHKGSSRRFMRAMETQVKLLTSGVEVEGREYLEQLPEGAKVIFAPTHTSDNDLPITASVLGNDFDLAIVDMSIHGNWRHSLKSVDPTILGIAMAGKENFLPITHTQKNGKRQGKIKPEDNDRIKAALDGGKAVVIAAHNPTFDGKLPKNPGFAAVRLAQSIDNAVVVPVAIQIGEPGDVLGIGDPKNILKTIAKRPMAHVRIGEPLKFDNQEARNAGAAIEDILGKHQQGIEWSSVDHRRYSEAKAVFKKDAGRLMKSLAQMLPPEKRGVWQEEKPSEKTDKPSEGEPRSLLEEKTLPELATEFVKVTDDMVKRRTDAITRVMIEKSKSTTEAFENPDSEDARAYESYEGRITEEESRIAKSFLGWDINPAKKNGEIVILSPGKACFILPYNNQAEGEDMLRYEFYGINKEGKIEGVYLEHSKDIDLDDYFTDENLGKIRAEEKAGVNFVPLDLKTADEIVHTLKVIKRWTGKMLYGIEPQPDEPV